MLYMDWKLALVTFSVLPFVALTAFLFRAKIRAAYRDIRLRLALLNSYLHERFTGIAVVRLFNREEADARRHAEINQDYLDAHLRSITYYALFFPVIELFTAIALALIIWRGGGSILQGTVTVGVLAAFLQYARRFFRPIQDLSEKYNLLQGAMASSERIFKLLDREIEIADPAVPTPLPTPVQGRIDFEDVWFAYGKDEDDEWDWVLEGVSFQAKPGERLAIVGHTGAGKTTLINLLMRFYEPQRGRIRLDGVPIEEIGLEELRAHIGFVLQDIFLPLQPGHVLQHPPRSERRLGGAYSGGRRAYRRRALHRAPAQRIRPGAGREGLDALSGRAPARILRPCPGFRSTGSGPRRGHQLGGLGDRGPDRAGHQRAHGGTDIGGDRPPTLHRSGSRPHHRAPSRGAL